MKTDIEEPYCLKNLKKMNFDKIYYIITETKPINCNFYTCLFFYF